MQLGWETALWGIKGGRMECEDNIHDWEHSSWGVIIGVSKCKKCGKVAKEEDFNKTGRGGLMTAYCLTEKTDHMANSG